MNLTEIIDQSFKTTREAIPTTISSGLYIVLIKFIDAAEDELIKKMNDKCCEVNCLIADFIEENSMDFDKETHDKLRQLESKINEIMS